MSSVVKIGECVDTVQLQYFQTDTLNFNEAQLVCESLGEGGNLAVPINNPFFTRMREFRSPFSSFYVGLIDLNGPNIIESQGNITDRFVSLVDGIAPDFTSGTPGFSPWNDLSFSNFETPRDLEGVQDCIIMFGTLIDISCDTIQNFMCQVDCTVAPTVSPTTSPTTLAPTISPIIPDAVGDCIDDIELVFFETRHTSANAQRVCEGLGDGGSLAVPIDEDFFLRMGEIISFSAWIGLVDPNGPNIAESQVGLYQ